MKVRKKASSELVEKLHVEGIKNGSNFWKAVAKGLNRPASKKFEVNLTRIEKHAKVNQKIVVPGVVLGSGEIKKKLTIAALKFSGRAKEKIEKTGGQCLSIEDLYEKNPKGTGLRIMG
ncbi:MAG: 50S ribosomal protein L18e [Candidatus Aenigmarchaeota archaeon]|nr:50S ribosomal protein L18e [Candidatus Aenigmarchaeota archaeon]